MFGHGKQVDEANHQQDEKNAAKHNNQYSRPDYSEKIIDPVMTKPLHHP